MTYELIIGGNENPNSGEVWVSWWCNFLNAVEEDTFYQYCSLSEQQQTKLINDKINNYNAVIDFKNAVIIFESQEDQLEFLLAWS